MTKLLKVCYCFFAIFSSIMALTLILIEVNQKTSESKRYNDPADNLTTVSDLYDFLSLFIYIILAILFKLLWVRS